MKIFYAKRVHSVGKKISADYGKYLVIKRAWARFKQEFYV